MLWYFEILENYNTFIIFETLKQTMIHLIEDTILKIIIIIKTINLMFIFYVFGHKYL
jgi:hypothetical protein